MTQFTPYSRYIHLSRYARWDDELKRRETWEETVARYCNFWRGYLGEMGKLDDEAKTMLVQIERAILDMQVMPSMRALMTAGKALERDNMAAFNCSYVAIDNPRAFDEIMYILMCGTGVGFSVERQYVAKLPEIDEEFVETDTVIKVADSRVGWAHGLKELIAMLYMGQIPKWDLSALRPAGARLKTFGGRASGPEPLDALFKFACALFKEARGRKLNSLEAHDLVCKIADVVVVGGVRRSALISLSNLSDQRMQHAKNGQWWTTHPHRALANNSACYHERPEFEVFLKEWLTLYESKSGERGIFSRPAATRKASENGRRKTDGIEFGTNPCGEILLRSKGLCNLTEVVVRPEDDFGMLAHKVAWATVLGTLQSLLTDFRYVRKEWRKNAEEERLLGVSLTGILDNQLLSEPCEELGGFLERLKALAIQVNAQWAAKLGINPSAAITCVKPSGTVSQLVNSASGIHPRYNTYYIRRVIGDEKDPVTQFMIAAGVPHQQSIYGRSFVFEFPMAAPENALTRKDIDAYRQLNLYAIYRKHWCEHNPSTTIYYDDNNFLGVGQWIWEHFDEVGGMALLPTDTGTYQQAPYEDITKEEYEQRVAAFPVLDWSKLQEFEKEDQTTGFQELACTAGICDI